MERPDKPNVMEIFLIFLYLGCTSFGGPTAHLAYFQREFVNRRAWLTNLSFSELVALSQSLPGPASSQVGFGIGMLRGGTPGAIAAWAGFTLPSALLMFCFQLAHAHEVGRFGQGVLHGLQLAAVAVIGTAVLSMQKALAPDWRRLSIAFAGLLFVLLLPPAVSTAVVVIAGGVLGLVWLQPGDRSTSHLPLEALGSRRTALIASVAFIFLGLAAITFESNTLTPLSLFATFFHAGALVFGGGHVVLPMLDHLIVGKGWMTRDAFMAGYGAAQALPGPLFTFAVYVGAAVQASFPALVAGILALLGIFTPGLLLMTSVMPFWNALRRNHHFILALTGVNAAVVGILAAALYTSAWKTSVHTSLDFTVALLSFFVLMRWRIAPVIVVAACGLISGVAAFLQVA